MLVESCELAGGRLGLAFVGPFAGRDGVGAVDVVEVNSAFTRLEFDPEVLNTDVDWPELEFTVRPKEIIRFRME